MQPDGKLVAAGGFFGRRASGVALARYNPDGSLDRSFGNGGLVLTDFGGSARASALVLQLDGKLVAAGVLNLDVLLARFNANGSLDTTFGRGGAVRTDFGGSDSAFALVLQQDGKLVAAGGRIPGIAGMSGPIILARYHPDGSLDASFGAVALWWRAAAPS